LVVEMVGMERRHLSWQRGHAHHTQGKYERQKNNCSASIFSLDGPPSKQPVDGSNPSGGVPIRA
ncbi:MAG: hypothetical protein WCQ20_15435, partial [Synechococcaceae cyanobacterium ELA739]